MDSGNRDSLNRPENFASDTIVQIALRQLHAVATNPKFWIGFVAIVIVLAIAGPFDTGDSLAFPARFFYWLVVALMTFFAGLTTSAAVSHILRRRGVPVFPAEIVSGLVAGLPVTAIVLAFNYLAFDFPVSGFAGVVMMFIYCTTITLAVIAVHALAVREPPRPANESTEASGAPRVEIPFLRRLKRPIGDDLISLQAQDHYVQATTTHGSEMILLRLSDAIGELEDTPGMRVHRSWWVAQEHMRELKRIDGRQMLILSDGSRVPVSRDRIAEIRKLLAAGA